MAAFRLDDRKKRIRDQFMGQQERQENSPANDLVDRDRFRIDGLKSRVNPNNPEQTVTASPMPWQNDLLTQLLDKNQIPTTQQMYGSIYQTYQRDPEAGMKMMDEFHHYQMNDPTSPWYNPYLKPTASEKQYVSAEPRTQKAEAEWAQLQQEIFYWAQQSDRNYSNEEIRNRINMKKYPTLSEMDEKARLGDPLKLNRAVGYSQEAIDGIIWAARNDGGYDSMEMDIAMSALGEGNGWKEDKEISDRLNPGNRDKFNPYSVGSTMDDERFYFGTSGFDQKWINDNWEKYMGSGDPTAMKMFGNVVEAEEYTQKLEAEKKAMQQQIDYLCSTFDDPDQVISYLKEDSQYKDLFDLDETLKRPYDKMKSTTRAFDFRVKDMEAQVRDLCSKKGKGASDVADTATGATVPNVSDAEKEVDKAAVDNMNGMAPSVEAKGTPEEKVAMKTGKALWFDNAVELVRGAKNTLDNYWKNTQKNIASDYMGTASVTYDYEQHQQEQKRLQEELDGLQEELNTLQTKKDAQLSLDGLPAEQQNRMRAIKRNSGDKDSWESDLLDRLQWEPDDYGALNELYREVTGFGIAEANDRDRALAEAKSWGKILLQKSPIDRIVDEANDRGDDADFLDEEYDGMTVHLEKNDDGEFEFTGYTDNETGENFGADRKDELEERVGYQALNTMTEEEAERYDLLTQREAEVQESLRLEDEYLEDEASTYRSAQMKKAMLTSAYAAAALSQIEAGNQPDLGLLETLDYAYSVSQTPQEYPWLSDSLYDMAVREGQMTREQATAGAAYTAVNNLQEIKKLKGLLADADELGLGFTDEQKANIQTRIDTAGKEAEASGYVMLDGNPDFEDSAKAGMEKAKTGQYGRIATAIATGHYGTEFSDVLGSLGSAAGNATTKRLEYMQECISVMTDEEKNRYFYLLEKDGAKAADRYFSLLTDRRYGALNVRRDQAVAEDMRKWAGQNFWTGLAATGLSFVSSFMEGGSSLVYTVTQKLAGKEINPYDPSYDFGNATSSLRGGVLDQLHRTFKEGTPEGTIAEIIYNGLTSSADSMINATATGGLFSAVGDMFSGSKLIGVFKNMGSLMEKTADSGSILAKIGSFTVKATKDFSYAAGMGLKAGASAYREAYLKYRDPDVAMRMSVATFFAETVSEAITVGNLHDAFARGGEGGKRSLADFIVTLAKDMGEEALGEGASEWITQNVEKIIEEGMYGYELDVKELTDQGYPESVAKQIVDQQRWHDIMIAAATGAVSAVFGTTREYVRGARNDTREATAKGTQEAEAPITSETVNEPPVENTGAEGENQAPITSETVIEAPVTEEAVNEAPVTDETVNEDPYAMLPEGTAQQDAIAEANVKAEIEKSEAERAQYDSDMNALSSLNDADPTGMAVGIAAVLNTGNPHLDKAAAQRLAYFGHGEPVAAYAMQELLKASGKGDNTALKQAIAEASMTNGQGSEALQKIMEDIQGNIPITAEHVNGLIAAVQQDQATEGYQDQLNAAIKASRVANRTMDIYKNGEASEKVATARKAVDQAKENLQTAQNVLQQAQDDLQVAKDAAVAASQAAMAPENAQNTSMAAAVQQTWKEAAGAANNVKQQEAAVEAAQQNVDQAQKECDKAENKVMAEARAQAISEVEQEMAQEAEAAAQAAEQQVQEDLNTAMQQYPPTKTFKQPITRQTANGPVQVTGIYYNDAETTVFTTTKGYMNEGDFTDDLYGVDKDVQKMVDNWNAADNPIKPPAAWLPHSMQFEDENHNPVEIVGFVGKNDDGDNPILMASDGKVYDSMDLYPPQNDPVTGESGTDALQRMFDWAKDHHDIPDMTDEEIYAARNPGVQMPEGFVAYPGGPQKVVYNGQWAQLVGMIPNPGNALTEAQYVLSDGTVVPAVEILEPNAEFFDWATEQQKEEISDEDWQHLTGQDNQNQTSQDNQNQTSQDSQNQASQPVTNNHVNPDTGEQLKPWQKKKYHGKVYPAKRASTKTKKFKNWFLGKMSPDAKPYLTNPDGSPRAFFRGYGGSMGSTLYMEAKSSPVGTDPSGKTVYKNFYMSTISTARSYTGEAEYPVLFRNVKNWETAKAAMQDIGYDLEEAPNPNGSGKMGYQVMRVYPNGDKAPAHGKFGTWFAENQLNEFKKTYGGGLKSDGIYVGYITSERPMIIDGHGSNWTSVFGDVTAPNGEHKSGTFTTDAWAKWAFQNGFDACILDNITDNMHGGGDVGTEVITSQPEMFKSAYNSGSWDPSNPSILAKKNGKSKKTKLIDLMGVKDLSPEFYDVMRRFENNESVPQEEIDALDEFAFINENRSYAPTVTPEQMDAIRKAGGGRITMDAVTKVLPENVVERIKKIKAALDKQGSAAIDKNGEVTYTGEVEQGKQLDLMFGLPASGKSTIADPLSSQKKSLLGDSDIAKEMILRDLGRLGNIDEDDVHNEGKIINDIRLSEAAARGDNVLFSVIGDNVESVKKRIQPFIDAGYTINIHYTDLPQNKALGRMLGRTAGTTRVLDFNSVRNLNPQAITDTFNILKGSGLIDEYVRWNTDVPRGENPIPVEYSGEDPSLLFSGRQSELGDALLPGETGNGGVSALRVDNGGSGGGRTDQSGELAAAPGRTDGRTDNGVSEQGTGQETPGRGTQGGSQYIRPDKSRVHARLLSRKTRRALSNKGVTDLGLESTDDQQRFSSALDEAKATNSHGLFVDAQSVEDLKNKGAITIMAKDGNAGVAIGTVGEQSGDIFGVFKNGKSKAKKASASLIIQAIAQGGNKLDCYDGNLRNLYSAVGMVPVARVAFNEEFAHPDWNYERDGKPDVVFWLHNGDSAETVAQKYGLSEEDGGYHIVTPDDIAALPLFDDVTGADGNTQYGYDRAWAYRDSLLADKMAAQVSKGGIKPLKAGAQNTTPTQKQSQKVKEKLNSPQRIAQNLVKRLGLGHYMGTKIVPSGTLGYWETHAKYLAIRNDQLGAYTTTMHEIGHGLADTLKLTGTPQMVSNLLAVSPEFGTSYDASELPAEAFAEFIWRYMEDEKRARAFAGDAFYDNFERQLEKVPGWADAVAEAKEELHQWHEASTEDQIGSTIVYDKSGDKPTWQQRLRDFLNGFVDKSHAAETVNELVREITGKNDLPIDMNVRNLSLLGNHSQKQAVYMLSDSLTDAKHTIIGDGLGKRLANVGFKGTKENLHLLEKYALSLHSIDRDAQGKPVFDGHITQKDRLDFIHEIETTREDIVKAEQAWQEFRHDFLQAWMVDTGYWSQEFLDSLEKMYPHYVPTFRVGGNVDAMKGVGGKTGKGYTLKEAVGGTQDIYSPLYSFIGMVDQIVTMVNNNTAAQAFDKLYQKYEGLGGIARQVFDEENGQIIPDESQMNSRQKQVSDLLNGHISGDLMDEVLEILKSKPGQNNASRSQNLLTVQRADGTTVRYQFDDPELYKLLAGVQDRSNVSPFSVIGQLTRTMSMLTTGSNPLFAARNAVRDFQNSVNYGTWASNYVAAVPKWLRTFWHVWRGDATDEMYKALGGGGWTRINSNDAKNMRDIQSDIFGDDRSTVGRTAKWFGKKLWDTITLDRLNEIIEQTSRQAEFRYGKHDLTTPEGRQEAFLAAQDVTVDFSRSGNSATADALKKLVPFFNAATQGVYRFGRQFTEGERGRAGTRFTKTLVNTALASALASGLILKFGDDDDKEEFTELLSNGIKSNHLILPNPLKGQEGQPPFLRIPLDQNPLTYAVHNLVTNALWKGTTDAYGISLAATVDTILDNLNPLSSGTVFQPFMDASRNRTWYGSNIIRTAQSDFTDPTGQYNEDTPGIFRWLGNLTNTSPEVIEYLATQYTGFLGAVGGPALTLDKNGNIGGFDAVMQSIIKKWTADPTTSNDVTSTFYSLAADLNTVKSEAKQGRPQGLLLRSLSQEQLDQAYAEAEEMLTSKGVIGRTKTLISDAYKEIDQINANDTLTDSQKADQSSKVRLKMLTQVQAANEALEAYKKKYMTGETLTDRVFGAIQKRFQYGGDAHIKTPEERLPEVFQTDRNNNSRYMQMSQEVYNATGKESALPHPSRDITLHTSAGEELEVTIPDESWDRYTNMYKVAYENYLLRNGASWDLLTDKQKAQMLTNAHSAGNKAIREGYAMDNGILLKN